MIDPEGRAARLAEMQREVKALIRFYERRGWNWLMAVEFHIARFHGWPRYGRWKTIIAPPD